ncbi:MAG: double-strand break repair protein AddB [Rhodospirillaceae bacterium]|nr:double-strand break repair protein AddB [Rhodospirillaceae bacterium]
MIKPKVYNIEPHLVFSETLAYGLCDRVGSDSLKLAETIILVPTRRFARVLEGSFRKLFSRKTILLPDIRALDAAWEDEISTQRDDWENFEYEATSETPISQLRRRLLLTQLVERYLREEGAQEIENTPIKNGYPPAVGLANELAVLLDRMQTEEIQFDKLDSLVPDSHAEHWQKTLSFLKLITKHWPKILKSENTIDPAKYRNDRLNFIAKRWSESVTDQRIIIAGSTGSIPATANLIKVIASLENGAVVLPGLDKKLDDITRRVVEKDVAHPQYTLHCLLQKLNITSSDVKDWCSSKSIELEPKSSWGRIPFIREAMLPASMTNRWSSLNQDFVSQKDLKNLSVIECTDIRSEAEVIALLFRETLETENKTAALITPNRLLARAVKSAVGRWKIDVEDTAGIPLIKSPAIVFWRLVGAMVSSGLAPIPLLAALKHPLSNGGLPEGKFQKNVRQLELYILRGRRPDSGIDGLLKAVKFKASEHFSSDQSFTSGTNISSNLLDWLLGLAPFIKKFEEALKNPSISLQELLTCHSSLVERLTLAPDNLEKNRLWVEEFGEQIVAVFKDLYSASYDFPNIDGRVYLTLFDSLLSDIVLRPKYQDKPRLAILGPLEGRLVHFDRIILGGLNEGSWPPEIKPDPWLGRGMREELGLSHPEIRIGQSAHDFVQACGAPEVFLTRSKSDNGAPTVPSRWLLRLTAVERALGYENALKEAGEIWGKWQNALDTPKKNLKIGPPAPKPTLEQRPRAFSATQIETWIRNPYAIYARKILNLRALEPIDPEPGASDRGVFIHKALEAFIKNGVPENRKEALSLLMEKGKQAFNAAWDNPAVWAFWWPRFSKIAEWFVEEELKNLNKNAMAYTETKGAVVLDGGGRSVKIVAVADRINRTRDNEWIIIDYKTGKLPSIEDILLGSAPQLAIEALILKKGGFKCLPSTICKEISYFHLTGGTPAGRKKSFSTDLPKVLNEAEQGLMALIAAFNNPEMPYLAIPDPTTSVLFDDYIHLARVKEWF